MIDKLETLLAIYQRNLSKEFIVNKAVFLRVLAERQRDGGLGTLKLNEPHASPRHRYINIVIWRGMKLTYITDEKLNSQYFPGLMAS